MLLEKFQVVTPHRVATLDVKLYNFILLQVK